MPVTMTVLRTAELRFLKPDKAEEGKLYRVCTKGSREPSGFSIARRMPDGSIILGPLPADINPQDIEFLEQVPRVSKAEVKGSTAIAPVVDPTGEQVLDFIMAYGAHEIVITVD